MMRMMSVAVLTAAVLAGACKGETLPPVEPATHHTVESGGRVVLRPGELAGVAGTQISILFRRVAQDSRCGIDALCVWEGDAHVQIAVTQYRRDWEELDLHTSLTPRAVEFEDHIIRLVEVAPSRRANDNLRPGDYSITLEVTRR